jgi:hypothetical protein
MRVLARNARPSPWLASPSITTRASPIASARGRRSEKSASAGSRVRRGTARWVSHATRALSLTGGDERGASVVAQP